ncbi:MAG TPA: hypothetical protein VGY56_17845, partial [Verrucomicrobiae bacterium]|nr:hypothetical protein [Verrucomicrobiae bacterium]
KRVSEYLEESPFRLARLRSQSLAMFCERKRLRRKGVGVSRSAVRTKLASLWRHWLKLRQQLFWRKDKWPVLPF